ncbi:MAG: hypothetical protein IKY54_03860 [Muribaculaceae bacterium]|nr:hypothetical protein [Paludibacteraceae bacterium]MBR4963018.1 hypothetical protein [Muribaculaceae bacterium]
MEQAKHYFVSVVIRVKGYNPLCFEGFFIPQNGECSISKIKTQCWNFIKDKIVLSKPKVDIEEADVKIKVKSIPYDFAIIEDRN